MSNRLNRGSGAPAPDLTLILETLRVLFDPKDVVELRAIFSKGKKRIVSGYYDGGHWDDLAQDAYRLSAEGAAVYVTLNPVNPQLLARCNNRCRETGTTTSGAEVLRRIWLLIDVDPQRPPGTSATDEQLALAVERAKRIRKVLSEEGWPQPVTGLSGNGAHLLYAIDLENDEEGAALVRGALRGLNQRFGDAEVKVDTSVYDANRIVKLYGTVANKGEHRPETPWRLSRLSPNAKRGAVVPEELLRSLIPPEPERTVAPRSGQTGSADTRGVLERVLGSLGIGYREDTHRGAERLKLERCPFNPEHGFGESAAFRWGDGRLGFLCFHNSCEGRTWRHVRELVDGPGYWERDALEGFEVEHRHPADEELPLPMPLPKLPPVLQFPAVILPDDLRDWAEDAAERACFPLEFLAVPAMCALGSLIGRRVGLRPKRHDDWTEFGNLWGAMVAPPGSMKSPAMSEALRPIKRLQLRALEEFAEVEQAWVVAAEESKLRREAAKEDYKKALKEGKHPDPLDFSEEPEKPWPRTYWTSDATVEKLGELAKQNPGGLLIVRDELASMLKKLEEDRFAELRGFYLSGWSGHESYRFDRIGRGTTNIAAYALSILGGIQPGPLAEFVRTSAAGSGADGLLQRLQLLVYPDSVRCEYVDRPPNEEARARADALFERIDAYQPDLRCELDVRGGPPYYRLSEKAQVTFADWFSRFAQSLQEADSETAALAAHLSKFRRLVPKLALILHLCDEPKASSVSERTLLKALSWLEYLEPHARRVYHAAYAPETRAAELLLARIRRGSLGDSPFKAWEISRNGWSGLGDTDAVKRACRLLAEYGWLIETFEREPVRTGRPSETRYIVSPLVEGTP